MHAWEAIQKSLDYIEEHISEEIPIEKLAGIAALSLFYYQRLFTRLVNRPVREYIKLRRLSRACGQLSNKELRIIDVAAEYGFDSHATFTRAFKDTYGLTPAQYRKFPVPLNHFDKPNLLLNYMMIDEGVPLISDGMVLEMNRITLERPVDFLGIEGCYRFNKGRMLGERPEIEISEVIWNKLHSILPDIPRLPGGLQLGVCYPGNAPEGYTSYFAGVQVSSDISNSNFDSWQLPSREYVICSFETEKAGSLTGSTIGKAMKYTRFWLKNHGLKADDFFPEVYYPSLSDSACMELWIPFKPRNNL